MRDRLFRDVLRELRKEKDWTQEALATRVGVTPLTVGKWETGATPPSCVHVIKMASLFDVSTDYLLGQSAFPRRIRSVDVSGPIPWQIRALPIHGMAHVALDIFSALLSHADGNWQSLLERIDGIIHKQLSRSDVLAICEQAIDCDWFKIGQVDRDIDLETQLIEKFNLKCASVAVMPPSTLPEVQKLVVAAAAADVFVSRVRNGDICSFSGGTTLLQMVRAIPHTIELTNVQFFPLDVNPHSDVIQYNAIYIIGILSAKLSAHSSSVHFSADPSGEFEASKLSPAAKYVYNMAQKATKTFVGIGDPIAQSFTGRPVIDAHLSQEELKELGAVSEVLFHLLDDDGALIKTPYNRKVPSIPIASLQQMATDELVVAVACGSRKAIPLKAALRGKHFSGVCIDRDLARTLVQPG